MPKPCLVLNNRFAIVRSSWGIHSTFLDQSTGKLCHIEALNLKVIWSREWVLDTVDVEHFEEKPPRTPLLSPLWFSTKGTLDMQKSREAEGQIQQRETVKASKRCQVFQRGTKRFRSALGDRVMPSRPHTPQRQRAVPSARRLTTLPRALPSASPGAVRRRRGDEIPEAAPSISVSQTPTLGTPGPPPPGSAPLRSPHAPHAPTPLTAPRAPRPRPAARANTAPQGRVAPWPRPLAACPAPPRPAAAESLPRFPHRARGVRGGAGPVLRWRLSWRGR